MSEATEKQISFAKSLNIADAESKSKETLKVLIDEALKAKAGKTEKTQPQAPIQANPAVVGVTQGIAQVNHMFQSSMEFGPAGKRHKIYYDNAEDLKNKIAEIQKIEEALGLDIVIEKH